MILKNVKVTFFGRVFRGYNFSFLIFLYSLVLPMHQYYFCVKKKKKTENARWL